MKDASIAEIRRRFLSDGAVPSRRELRRMERDPRAGVRQVARTLRRRRQAESDEASRIRRMLRYERVLWRRGAEVVAGVDESGVGPLAGPVVAAAVAFPPRTEIRRVDDCKKIDQATRQELEREIADRCTAMSVGVAEVDEIDRLNIYHAALLAMRRAVELLPGTEFVLTDARRIPDLARPPQRAVRKGDRNCFSVAAASILAKNHRDRLMLDLDRRFPQYGFASHKGYSTARHFEAIRRHGPSPVHRRSFHVIAELNGDCSAEFYRFQKAIAAAKTPARLRQLASRLKERRECLKQAEVNKLRILLNRKLKSARNT